MAIDFEPATIDFQPETTQIDFEPEGASVAQMASATRATVGVVGRAVRALDFAVAGYDAPDRSQLEDGYQPDESAIAPMPGNVEPKAVRALPEMVSNFGKAMMTGLPFPRVTAQEVTDSLLYLGSLADMPPEYSEAMQLHNAKPGNLEKIIAGAQRAAVSVPESFTSPFGIATVGAGALPGTLGRVVAGGFAVDMASHIPEQTKQLKEAIDSGDSERITEASGNLLVAGAMIAATGKHALTKPNPAAKVGAALMESIKATEFVDPKIAALRQVAPLTAEAVAKVAPEPTVTPKPGDVFQPGDLVDRAPEIISPTPLTAEAVAKVVEKEPVPPPAPTPAESIVETGFLLPSGKIVRTGLFHDGSKLPEQFQADPGNKYTEVKTAVKPGFITSTGRFVSRDEAALIGKRSGQMEQSETAPAWQGNIKLKEPVIEAPTPTPAAVESYSTIGNELRQVWPELTASESVKAVRPSDGFPPDLKRKFDAAKPEQQAAIDDWFSKNDDRLNSIEILEREQSILNRLRRSPDASEFAEELSAIIGDQNLPSNFIGKAAQIASERGFDRTAMSASVKMAVQKRYGEDADFMMAEFLKEQGAEPPVAKPEGERTLTTVPEHLRPSKSTQAILDSQPATPPPEGGIKPKPGGAPEGGAIFGIGGRRPAPPRPVGDTPRGDKNWLRIPSAIRRVGRGLFTEGARAVLERTRNQVGQELSRATRKHVDVEQELFGMHEATLRTAVRTIPRQRLDAAMTEASQYFREVENGRPAPAMSPEAQSLVDSWFAIGRSTGDIARANNVMVFDPALGSHRPIGNVSNYVPRMFTAEVEAVLRDPQTDPALFNRLAQEIATARGITLEEGAAELRGVAGRFQANDYMANLELARGAQMPELFYEYNLRNLAARYLPSFSERMAQIIAYGQRLGPRDAPQRQNLWDVARRESEDAYTQEWLNAAEDQGTGFKTKSTLERAARRMQALSSATLLSDPTTTVVRNLLSGLSATTEAYGVGRSVRQLRNSMRMVARLGAREIGAIRDDLASFLNSDQLGDSALDNAIRRTSEFALRASGFTGSENFVRTHNALVASTFARDAAAALVANPASRLSREALAQFQRWNINPETIIAEGGNWRAGPETRRYIRTAVREMQGGYRFDQVPLWGNSTAGRFFYQYGRWGVQRSQNIFQNIIRPAIGEDVQFRGQRMTHRDALPLIRTGALLIGLGETFSAISSGLFGKDRRDSSLSEIAEAWSEDELKAVGLLGERMVNDIIMAGTLGIIGQPLDIAKAAKDQSRFKNPLDPPSAAGIKTLIALAQKAVDQDGTLTKKDWLSAASGIVRGPKNVSDVARHHLGESLYEGQNDQRTLRNSAMRWAKETKQDVPVKAVTEIRKSPTAPHYEAVNEALLSGNAEAAKKAADEFIAEQKDEAKARTALKASVNARQPFRAGNMTSDAHKNDFMRWAEKNLSAADLEQIKRVQERYEKTASDAGLL